MMAYMPVSGDPFAALVLDALGAAAGPIAVVRPVLDAGRVVDGDVLWLTPSAQTRSGLVAGGLLSDVYGTDIAHMPPTLAAQAALRTPGVQVTVGPYKVHRPEGGSLMYEVSAITYLDMVVVSFLDRTEQVREHQMFHEILDGLDTAVMVLQPQLVDGVVVDAVVDWSNLASRSAWVNPRGTEPGAHVLEGYFDSEAWLDLANAAWSGAPATRIMLSDPTHLQWGAAIQVVTRLGDVLVESTHDRSQDVSLLERIAESDFRFATLIEDLPSTVFAGEFGKSRFEFVSPNCLQLLGLPPQQLQRFSDVLALVHPDDRPTAASVSEWVAAGSPHYSAEWRIHRADGTECITAVSAVRRRSPSGADGFLGLFQDVTEQRRVLQQFEAGERLRSLGRAASAIAHDFNNLLMVVAGNIDRVQRSGSAASQGLTDAKVAADKAAELARTMMTFARSQPGRPAPVSIDHVVDRCVTISSAEISSGVRMTTSIPVDLPPVFADELQVAQVLHSLVSNAHEAVGASGTVSISAALVERARCHLLDNPGSGGPFVMVTVADDGQGVPKELLLRVWEPFFTSKVLSKEHGTGLGLSTAHGIVHQHDGHLTLDSEPGRGTSVSFYLPALTDLS